jgi:hypothetical protein
MARMNEFFAEARAALKFMAAASVLGRLVETLPMCLLRAALTMRQVTLHLTCCPANDRRTNSD